VDIVPKQHNHTTLGDNGLVDSEFENIYNSTNFQPVYCEYYAADEISSVVVSASAADIFFPMTGFIEGICDTSTLITRSNDQVIINQDGDGIYDIDVTASFEASKVSTIHCIILVNGVSQPNMEFQRKIATTNQVGSAAFSGYFNLNQDDMVQLAVSSDSANTTITFLHVNWTLKRQDRTSTT
jgi:hypothetical protein